jgi:hypothetical protein
MKVWLTVMFYTARLPGMVGRPPTYFERQLPGYHLRVLGDRSWPKEAIPGCVKFNQSF